MEKIELASHEDITHFTDEEQVAVKKIDCQYRQESKLKGVVRSVLTESFYEKAKEQIFKNPAFDSKITYES